MDEKNLIDKSVDEILDDILKQVDIKKEVFSDTQNENLVADEVVLEPLDSKENDLEEQEVEEETRIQPKKKNKKCKKAVLVFVATLLCVIIVALIFVAKICFDVFGISGSAQSQKIEIELGYTPSQIATVLEEKGIIDSALAFRLYFKMNNPDGVYHYGVFELSSKDSYQEIIYKLRTPGQEMNSVTVTFPEGYNIDQIANELEKNSVCSKNVFIATMKEIDLSSYEFLNGIRQKDLYYTLEGYLYPDTYNFSLPSKERTQQDCAQLVFYKMLDRTKQILQENNFVSLANSKGKTIHEVFTLASILELEASSYPSEMPKVAQVFYNRLAWKNEPAMLGSTPTADYPDARYDTNQNIGLPPGPLCSVSINSIKAAINPDTSVTADYFVTDKNMKFYYTENLSEHNALIRRLKSEGLWY